MAKREITEPGRQPVLFIAVGRQRVGKTALLNALAQFLRERGGKVAIWNADTNNRTHSLALFHEDVLQPPSSAFEDTKGWLEERIADQVRNGYDAILDVGGGETPLFRLAQEIPVVSMLGRRGIRLVLAHVIGPEKADLDYLEQFMANGLFVPEATLLILNAGLVLSGRSAVSAFAAIRQHPVLLDALKRGAEIELMPPLACMSQVTDRGLSFAEAANGGEKPGHAPLSFFDQERVAIWWERDIPSFFGRIPALWLPAVQTIAEAVHA